MKYSFKNGITIEIPDSLTKEQTLAEWTRIKMEMSLILSPLESAGLGASKVRKKYTRKKKFSLSEETRKKLSIAGRKSGVSRRKEASKSKPD